MRPNALLNKTCARDELSAQGWFETRLSVSFQRHVYWYPRDQKNNTCGISFEMLIRKAMNIPKFSTLVNNILSAASFY
jgi:hypothetical protein